MWSQPNICFVDYLHDFHHAILGANDPDSDTRLDDPYQNDPDGVVEASVPPAVILPVREGQLSGLTESCWAVQC
jgi:hypothetical protein